MLGFGMPKGSRMNDLVFAVPAHPLDQAAKRTFFAEHGFLHIPGALDPARLVRVRAAVADLGPWTEELWHQPELIELIGLPSLVEPIRQVLGPELRFFKGAYVRTGAVGSPAQRTTRQALHRDYGIGEAQDDFRNSNACWLNAGIYLTDLAPERGPLWVVPGSHRLLTPAPGSDASTCDGQARMVLARAGDIVLFHCLTLHAGGANLTAASREGLFYSYRAAWARPIGPVPEWPARVVENAPPELRALLIGQNDGLGQRSTAPAYA